MQNSNNRTGEAVQAIDTIWLKAAVCGGLWASVEIILGSFLHNLRVPMAGSVLASFGIVLMVAFFQIWPERGLIWRAGLICALMKSVSPSAVILGPMTGIMMEALLLEMGIRLLGKNLAGYLMAGSLALLSALLHKLMSLILLYGLNILTIYLNLFYFASRQINIPDTDPWILILVVGILYLLFGALAALAGYAAGRRAIREPAVRVKSSESGRPQHDIFEPSEASFSMPLFILHVLAIPGGLLLMNFSQRIVAYPVMILYTLFCLLYYRNTIRRFQKPLFWFQLLVIILLASVFLDSFENGAAGINWSGVLSGVDMNIRAILVVAGFSAISIELKNPLITNFLVKKGFRQVYLAISLAFSALPAMMEEISQPRRFISRPFSSIRNLVSGAPLWLETLSSGNNRSSGNNNPDR